MTEPISIGQLILEEIVKQGMVRAEAIGDSMLFVWNGNAAEQLDALVADKYKPIEHDL